jgi:L-seryl-tRNA(Ser) seleniumtransferase
VTLREVGATNRSAASDYEAALSNETAAILKISADTYHVAGETASATLEELFPLARDRELPLIDILGAAPLVEPPANISWPRRSARESLAAGTDIVILRGDGLVGGPCCGIVLGKRDVIERLMQLPLFAAMKLDPLRAAALAATVECYGDASRGADSIPAWQCLATSVENLKNRAERMAGQLAHAPGVASATAIETRSPLSAAIAGEGWPSYGVALTAAENNIAALDERLKAARFPIVGRMEGSQLVLDLRTVLPRQDRQLVDSLLGPAN